MSNKAEIPVFKVLMILNDYKFVSHSVESGKPTSHLDTKLLLPLYVTSKVAGTMVHSEG